MKKTTVGLSGILLAAALSLSACGNSAEDYAGEYCDLMEDVKSAQDAEDPEKLQEAAKALSDWAEKNKDEEVDEDDFKDAVKDECPDFADQMP